MKKQQLLIPVALLLIGALSQNAQAGDALISGNAPGSVKAMTGTPSGPNNRGSNGNRGDVNADEWGEPAEFSEEGTPIGQVVGSFDGYDMKKRAVWINDYRYELYPGFKVYDKRSRISSLESITMGEEVVFIARPNRKDPKAPYVVEIRRH